MMPTFSPGLILNDTFFSAGCELPGVGEGDVAEFQRAMEDRAVQELGLGGAFDRQLHIVVDRGQRVRAFWYCISSPAT